ncbi:MAG: sulfur carrier protein [Flavobacteriales bacterium]|jgi:sulfur carrier protein
MIILFNGEEISLDTSMNLAELLSQKKLLHTTGIAVAINQAVISKNDWTKTALNNNDNILVITATQGG